MLLPSLFLLLLFLFFFVPSSLKNEEENLKNHENFTMWRGYGD
jgi:hypothetical protein